MDRLADSLDLQAIGNAVPGGLVLLAMIWAVEHFLIQRRLFDAPPITAHPAVFQGARLVINLLTAICLVLLCSMPWLLLVLFVDFLLSIILVTYQHYFDKPLSLGGAWRQLREGIKVAGFGIRLVPVATTVAMLFALLTNGLLAWSAADGGADGNVSCLRIVAAGIAFVCLAGLIVLLQFTSFRFTSIRRGSLHRCIYAYGYLLGWCAEILFSPGRRELAREAARGRVMAPDRLPADAIPLAIDNHVVMVQVESLDWNLLDFELDGRPVTPFINQAASAGLVFKPAAYHHNGSADMDFAVLSGSLPSRWMLNYHIPGQDYTDALPGFMADHGFHSVSLHGATGHFFNRREHFQRMGWHEVWFREELLPRAPEQSYWGVRDRELFALSTSMLTEAAQPQFHFIITLDSHGPFDLITDEEKHLFPGSRRWQENYFNSMAVLDKNLRDYADRLPDGTLLVIYGDHSSGVHHGTFTPARTGGEEHVPCIILRCGHPLAPAPVTMHKQPDDLGMLDIVSRLRGMVSASRPRVGRPH